MDLQRNLNYSIDGAKFISSYYYSTGNFSAKPVSVASDRCCVLSPSYIAADIGGAATLLSDSQELNINNDSSWDFGQNIGTWTPNHLYYVSDRGSLYTQGTYGITKNIAGGTWSSGSVAGSLGRSFANYPWTTDSGVSFRTCCESLEQ